MNAQNKLSFISPFTGYKLTSDFKKDGRGSLCMACILMTLRITTRLHRSCSDNTEKKQIYELAKLISSKISAFL